MQTRNAGKELNVENEVEEFMDEELAYDEEDSDSEPEEETNVERQFNFVSELSVLVDYNVIDKYISVLKSDDNYSKNPFLVKACTTFFRRIINQTK